LFSLSLFIFFCFFDFFDFSIFSFLFSSELGLRKFLGKFFESSLKIL